VFEVSREREMVHKQKKKSKQPKCKGNLLFSVGMSTKHLKIVYHTAKKQEKARKMSLSVMREKNIWISENSKPNFK